MDENKKLKRFAKKYALIVAIMVGSFALVGSTAMLVFTAMQASPSNAKNIPAVVVSVPKEEEEKPSATQAPIDTRFTPPDRTTVLILGIHELSPISDVILLATYDAVNEKIDVISLPRDTRITLPKEDVNALHKLGRTSTPSHGVMKLGELHSYAGTEYGPKEVEKFVENMLGVQIDYYTIVSIRAFRDIVDAVGGVYMEVPKNGLRYSDPEQNLYINVPGGYQLLDGNKAEGVVRYRATYRNGDLDRIAVQQTFMTNFVEQAFTKEAISNNFAMFASTVISYVKTDFGLDSLPKYLTSFEKLKPENITFHTLPGNSQDINGGSYYIYDKEKGAAFVNEIFYPQDSTDEKRGE